MARLLLALTVLALIPLALMPSMVKACPGGEMKITQSGGTSSGFLMISGSATFDITTTSSVKAYFQHILLVMTKTSYDGLTGAVQVDWTGGSNSFSKAVFITADGGYVPPQGAVDGGKYLVSELKACLGVNGSLYYALGFFLQGPVGQTIQSFTVTLPSSQPRMLVLAIGNSACSSFFNIHVTITTPGFVVSDPSPILLAMASFSALGLYAFKKKKS